MGTGMLTIDLGALVRNWQALDAISGAHVETAAVVKANGYGLGAGEVANALANAGARVFFVATAEEGAALRQALGAGPDIRVFAGHMEGDTALIRDHDLTPMLNSADQFQRHQNTLPWHPYGIQLDTGMNRLGIEPGDWGELRATIAPDAPVLVMSHLACADEPLHGQNTAQLEEFTAMTEGMDCPRSLSATGGILLGPQFHFDMTRPGVGMYGGLPFEAAEPVVRVSLPVIQTRELSPGETVGYGASWTADETAQIATVSGGYADGIIRRMSNNARLFAGDVACPLAGRVSMDLLTVDVSHLGEVPDALDILCPHQTVDQLAERAGTIGYEILTQLSQRYARRYVAPDA